MMANQSITPGKIKVAKPLASGDVSGLKGFGSHHQTEPRLGRLPFCSDRDAAQWQDSRRSISIEELGSGP